MKTKSKYRVGADAYDEDLYTLGKGRLIRIGEYRGQLAPILHKCIKHDHEYLVKPNFVKVELQRGPQATAGCAWCAVDNGRASYATKEHYLQLLKEKRPEWELIGKLKGSSIKVKHRCKIHNKTFLIKPHKALLDHKSNPDKGYKGGCKECARELKEWQKQNEVWGTHLRNDFDEFLKQLKKSNPHYSFVKGQYWSGSAKSYRFKCKDHNLEFEYSAGSLRKPTFACHDCKRDKWWNNIQGHPQGSIEEHDAFLKKNPRKVIHVDKSPWKGYSKRRIYLCKIHGREVRLYPTDVENDGKYVWCRQCSIDKMSKVAMQNAKHGYPFKQYKLGRHLIKVQGYEPKALDILSSLFSSQGIFTQGRSKIPTIPYMFTEYIRYHYPDIYLPAINTLVEVKSTETFGFKYKPLFEKIKAKRKGAIKAGYQYFVMVFDGRGNLIKLPTRWWNLTYKEFRKWVKYMVKKNKALRNARARYPNSILTINHGKLHQKIDRSSLIWKQANV